MKNITEMNTFNSSGGAADNVTAISDATIDISIENTTEWRPIDLAANATELLMSMKTPTGFNMGNTTDHFNFDFVHTENMTSSYENSERYHGVGQTVFIAIVAVCAMISNLLVILTAYRGRNTFQRNMRYLACSMAVADFISGLLYMWSLYPSTLGYWPYSSALCTALAVIHDIDQVVVLTTLAYISIDRYVSLVRPQGMMQSRRFCGAFIVLTWAIPSVWRFALYMAKKMTIVYARDIVLCASKSLLCYIDRITVFFVGGSLTWIFLLKTWRITANQRQVAPTQSAANQSSELTFWTLFALTAMQHLLWVPEALLGINHALKLVQMPVLGKFWIVWLGQTNTFLDFIIYSLMQRSFVKALKWQYKGTINFLYRNFTGQDFFGAQLAVPTTKSDSKWQSLSQTDSVQAPSGVQNVAIQLQTLLNLEPD